MFDNKKSREGIIHPVTSYSDTGNFANRMSSMSGIIYAADEWQSTF
ncbi:hypothetical protein LMG33818_000761 [Halomonadaceae bacterium LMG 33818]